MCTKNFETTPSDVESTITYSFDIFDTCITRTQAHPRDLFYDLGLQLAPKNVTRKKKRKFAMRFQSVRIRAEKNAHKLALPRRTITIGEIYQQFPMFNDLPIDIPELVQAEIDLEQESIYSVPVMISHIENLRRAGSRIIFISDMYLPSDILAPILKKHGVMKDEDTLYVSCDVGLTKHHGQLFKHVLEAEGLAPSELIHTGDNPHADIRMAAKANIRTNHFRDGMLTPFEADMAGYRLPRHRSKSFLAALARRLRLYRPEPMGHQGHPLDHVIEGTIVPFLLSYVAWILEHAKRNGICRLYFVARDAEILYRMAQAMQNDGGGIELRYIYGSRRAWLPPSISLSNTDWQRLLVIPGQTSSRHDIASRMGLDTETQEVVRSSLSCSAEEWLLPLSHDRANAFVDELLANTVTSELIGTLAEKRRESLLCYFTQEGLFDSVPWALVDAGWSLNSQAALKRILDASGSAHQVPRGYYLGLARDHLGEAQAGVAYTFVREPGSIFSRRRVIIEHCFLPSTHATTIGYQMEGNEAVPLFGPELRDETELTYMKRLHDSAICAAQLFASDKRFSESLTEHVEQILSNAKRLLKHPSKSQALEMATFGTVADMRHEKIFVEPLCGVLRLRDAWIILAMSLSRKKTFESPSFMWLEGSMALSPMRVRVVLRLLLFFDSMRNWMKDKN